MAKKKKKGKKKNSPTVPQPYHGSGYELTPDTGIIQASQMLDIAAFAAQASGKVDEMVKVSQGWLQMSGTLAGIAVAQSGVGDAGDMQSQVELGFRAPNGFGTEPIEEYEEVEDHLPMGFRSMNDR